MDFGSVLGAYIKFMIGVVVVIATILVIVAFFAGKAVG